MKTEQQNPQQSDRMLTAGDKFSALAVAGACALLLMACEGATGPAGSASSAGPPGTGIAASYELLIQLDTNGDGAPDTAAAVNPIDFTITRSAPFDAGSDGTFVGSDKAYFHNQAKWIQNGTSLWAFDMQTFALLPRKDNPSFQANRELTVSQGQVNTKSGAGAMPVSKELRAYAQQWESGHPFSVGELQTAVKSGVTMCDVLKVPGASAPSTAGKAPADTIVHDMGNFPVGTAQTPDGKLVSIGVRWGDHNLVIDNDPASPTFKEPVRFVGLRSGVIKDKTNAVVATFPSIYSGFGGTAPGNLHFTTGLSAPNTGGEVDPTTYDETCDSNALRNAKGEVWMYTMAIDGDTHTGMRLDTILSANPTVVQFPVPVVSNDAIVGSVIGAQVVLPVMGTIHNRAAGGEFLYSVENSGEPSESIYDVTDPANPVEVERIVSNLANIKAAAGGTLTGPFVNNTTYAVNVVFTSTGGGPNSVNYQYKSLAGDNLSGASTTVTTAYLQKVTATDPGPNFIINGFVGSAISSEGNFASMVGTGTDRVIFSDQLWLFTTAGARPFQVVNLATSAPWLITESVDFPNTSAGKMAPDNLLFQVRNGNLEAIDTKLNPHSLQIVKFHDPATGAPWTVSSLMAIRGL